MAEVAYEFCRFSWLRVVFVRMQHTAVYYDMIMTLGPSKNTIYFTPSYR